jgi:transposase
VLGGVIVKYTKEERLNIGRRVYAGELTEIEAQQEYRIGRTCVQNYVYQYKVANGIPTKKLNQKNGQMKTLSQSSDEMDISVYEAMSKEELIEELIRAKVNELRAKKGYEVKGDGANKEYISLNNKNTKSS